ncbi:hypothetical protein AAFN86_28625 [Roseomonas sp. CAU 1739]|uniref:hypothetical protein n=1 Tax=Roseomonas sp. CAU 1739 TaxID=3140364 RepID=UPI00325AED66
MTLKSDSRPSIAPFGNSGAPATQGTKPMFRSEGFSAIHAVSASAAARVFAEQLAFEICGDEGFCGHVRQVGQGIRGDFDCFIAHEPRRAGATIGETVRIHVEPV